MKPIPAQSIAQVALLLALAFLPAACGGGSPGGGQPTLGTLVRDTPAPAPAQPELPSAAPAAPSVEISPPATTPTSAANVLIVYHKSGGIAGINETLTVYADGKLEQHSKIGDASAQADPADIQALQQLLASPEFAALELPQAPIMPDQFVYELTAPGRAQPIVTADGADKPPVLDQLIELLEKLKSQVQ
jgi:hypothetical protein